MNKQKSAKNLEKNWLNWSDQTKFIEKHKEKLVKVVWPWISAIGKNISQSVRNSRQTSFTSKALEVVFLLSRWYEWGRASAYIVKNAQHLYNLFAFISRSSVLHDSYVHQTRRIPSFASSPYREASAATVYSSVFRRLCLQHWCAHWMSVQSAAYTVKIEYHSFELAQFETLLAIWCPAPARR